MPDEFLRKMNEIGEGTKGDIQPPTDDTTFERKSRDLVKLYQVSDESGELTVTEVGGYPLKRELLDSKVCTCTYACMCTWVWGGLEKERERQTDRQTERSIEREEYLTLLILFDGYIQDAFILDTGAGGIFAWLGSGATQQEKKAAFKNAVVSYHHQYQV